MTATFGNAANPWVSADFDAQNTWRKSKLLTPAELARRAKAARKSRIAKHAFDSDSKDSGRSSIKTTPRNKKSETVFGQDRYVAYQRDRAEQNARGGKFSKFLGTSLQSCVDITEVGHPRAFRELRQGMPGHIAKAEYFKGHPQPKPFLVPAVPRKS